MQLQGRHGKNTNSLTCFGDAFKLYVVLWNRSVLVTRYSGITYLRCIIEFLTFTFSMVYIQQQHPKFNLKGYFLIVLAVIPNFVL